MLHVERGVHVDACIHDREDVLPALGMEQAGGVGVGHLIDEQHLRPAGNCPAEVELTERVAAIGNRQPRQHLESLNERGGLGAAVGLDDANDHVGAVGHEAAGRFEHGIRFADAGREPEKNLEPATSRRLFLRLDAREERVGIRA